jgi:hypothetical protein
MLAVLLTRLLAVQPEQRPGAATTTGMTGTTATGVKQSQFKS